MSDSNSYDSGRIDSLTGRTDWRHDPVIWGFAVLAMAAYIVGSIESDEWISTLVLMACVTAASLVVTYLTRKREHGPLPLRNPAREGWAALAWYAVFVGISLVTGGGEVFGNEFLKWVWFVVLPLLMIYFLRSRKGFREVMRSIGFRREGLGKSLLLALLAYAVAFAGIMFFLPDTQMDKLRELIQEPVKLQLVLPLSFGFALITAAITEEVFFRGVLQTRLSAMMRSEVKGLLVAALLFGLYHLPYAYFSVDWSTHGNIFWAASSVITEQAVTGLVLGVLWMRTRNLAAPVLFHALVNTLAIMTMFNIGTG